MSRSLAVADLSDDQKVRTFCYVLYRVLTETWEEAFLSELLGEDSSVPLAVIAAAGGVRPDPGPDNQADAEVRGRRERIWRAAVGRALHRWHLSAE